MAIGNSTGNGQSLSFSSAAYDKTTPFQTLRDSQVFITSRGARFRCTPYAVERLFCSQADKNKQHVMSGTLNVLTDKFATICQQNGTYIVKTNEGQYADLHCLKEHRIVPMDQFPVPVGAFQKNLEYEQIEVACANLVNGDECGKLLMLGRLSEHLETKTCDSSVSAAESLSEPEEMSDFDENKDDDKCVKGLLSEFEQLRLNQWLQKSGKDSPESDMAIAREMAATCDGEPASYDGTLEWKISDFQSKKQQADSGKRTMLSSPPFYTPTGYKMCVKAHLAGYLSAEKESLSLSVAIMKTDKDNELKWPFREIVTLTLLNQSAAKSIETGKNSADHIARSFAGVNYVSSCQKPVTAMNTSIGFPDFLECSKLDNRYVKNDCIVIQVKVEPPVTRKIFRAKRRLPKTGGELAK